MNRLRLLSKWHDAHVVITCGFRPPGQVAHFGRVKAGVTYSLYASVAFLCFLVAMTLQQHSDFHMHFVDHMHLVIIADLLVEKEHIFLFVQDMNVIYRNHAQAEVDRFIIEAQQDLAGV